MSVSVSLKELIESGAHFGHQTKRWNPKMGEFIYGEREGVHIFDLTKTKPLIEEALEVLARAAKEGKAILFVGTKKQAKEEVKRAATEAGVFYISERWLGGVLTNFDQIKKSVKRMNDLKTGLESGEFSNRTKKERLLLQRDKERLERFFGGLNGIEKMPELMVIVDTKRERTAIKEANAMKVEVVGIVDTNADPLEVDYPIPMNDDATKAISYILDLFKEAILIGRGSKKDDTKKKEK